MELARQTLKGLCDVIHELSGLALGPEKAYLVRHRLTPLIEREGIGSFEQLLNLLQTSRAGRLHDAIIEAITTKETSFFRDRSLFDALRAHVLPDCVQTLRESAGRRHRIRIWSAACSTGQEPYSVAMLIRELVDAHANAPLSESEFTILATDLSAEALEFAENGKYREHEVARGLSAEMLAHHFRHRGSSWAVDAPLRKLVQFRKFDLLRSPTALGAFDLILCRNVLIYFDEPTRVRVLGQLCSTLQPGGWIALGAAENFYGTNDELERVKFGRAMLYRKPHRSR